MLNRLIAELCPNGVEYLPIGNLANYEQPAKYIVNSTDYNDDFEIPVLTAGQSFVLGYTNEREGVYPATKEDPVIIFDDFTGAFKWVDFPFKVKSSAIKMLKAKEDITFLRYIFHVMGWLNYSSSEHRRLWISIYSEFKVPVPPIEVQHEIVRVLDKFAELTTELTTELKTELTARKKQYEYYLHSLIFDKSYPLVELRSVVKTSYAGATPKKGNALFYDNGTIPWIRTQDVRFNEIYEVDSFITEIAVEKTAAKWIPENCVIVAISGATAGRCAINKIKATTNQHCLNMVVDNEKALYQYVYYCVYGRYDELLSRKQGARGDLNSSLILGVTIPLPSIETQKEIVSKINIFNKLLKDLSSDIPAEIEARKQQYEYYRDKLLTFKEKT